MNKVYTPVCKQVSNNPSRTLVAACLPICAYLRAPRTGSSRDVDGTAEGSWILSMSDAFTWVASVVRPFTKRALFAQNLAMSPLSSVGHRKRPARFRGRSSRASLASCHHPVIYHNQNHNNQCQESTLSENMTEKLWSRLHPTFPSSFIIVSSSANRPFRL